MANDYNGFEARARAAVWMTRPSGVGATAELAHEAPDALVAGGEALGDGGSNAGSSGHEYNRLLG